MLSGKLTEQRDWNHALHEVLQAPVSPLCVLTVISDGRSGSIGVRHGRYLVGAHTSDGTTGVAALRLLISMQHGFYSYLSAEGVSDQHQIDQGLNVDIRHLLTDAPATPSDVQQTKSPSDAKQVTAMLRQTLQGLRPVSASHINLGSQEHNADNGAENDFIYAPGMLLQPDCSRPQSVLGKVISGARTTYMKLASLRSRSSEPKTLLANEGVLNDLPSEAPNEFSPGMLGLTKPEMPPPPASREKSCSTSLEREETNVVDSVRATAWRIASRVVQAAQRKSVADSRVIENRKLRAVETDTAEMVATVKQKRKHWPPDGLTILFAIGLVLGVSAVAGGVHLAVEMSGNKPHMELGRKYIVQNRLDLAIMQFTLALDKSSSDYDALQLRAHAYEDQKDYEHAAVDYARLAQVSPNALEAGRKAVFCYYKVHKYTESEHTCRKALERNPDDQNLLAQHAMVLGRLGKYREAVDFGSKLKLEQVPPYLVPDVFGSLGFASWRLGNNNNALKYFSRALAADPANVDVLTDRANAHMALKNYKRAAADYALAVKNNPGKAEGYISLATSLEQQKEFANAAEQLRIAVKLAPTGALYLKLAIDDFLAGRYGAAVAECDDALQLNPRLKAATDFRTVALLKAKKGKAIVVASLTPDIGSDNGQKVRVPNKFSSAIDPLVEAGRSQMEAGHFNDAAATFARSVLRNPSDAAARRYYAYALLAADRPKQAFEQFDYMSKQGLLLLSDEATYAKTAESAGHYERAIQLYSDVLIREPSYSQGRVRLIQALVAKGYHQKARAVVHDGITIDKSSETLFRDALSGALNSAK